MSSIGFYVVVVGVDDRDHNTTVMSSSSSSRVCLVFGQTNNGNHIFHTEHLGDVVIFEMPRRLYDAVMAFDAPVPFLKYLHSLYLDEDNDMETDCSCCSPRWFRYPTSQHDAPLSTPRSSLPGSSSAPALKQRGWLWALKRLQSLRHHQFDRIVVHHMGDDGVCLSIESFGAGPSLSLFRLECYLAQRSFRTHQRDYGSAYPYVRDRIGARWEQMMTQEEALSVDPTWCTDTSLKPILGRVIRRHREQRRVDCLVLTLLSKPFGRLPLAVAQCVARFL